MSRFRIIRRCVVLMVLATVVMSVAALFSGSALAASQEVTHRVEAATPEMATTAALPCGEAACTPVQAAYISHYTGTNCTGTESYYTAYFNFDGIRRSWNGQGNAGTILRTVTNRSWRSSSGVCTTQWPNGNTLSNFVTIYR